MLAATTRETPRGQTEKLTSINLFPNFFYAMKDSKLWHMQYCMQYAPANKNCTITMSVQYENFGGTNKDLKYPSDQTLNVRFTY